MIYYISIFDDSTQKDVTTCKISDLYTIKFITVHVSSTNNTYMLKHCEQTDQNRGYDSKPVAFFSLVYKHSHSF
jgi:hypothetical protein